jgi:hypothetical protein
VRALLRSRLGRRPGLFRAMLVQLLCVGPRCPSDVCHSRCRVTALPNGELPWRGTAGQADRGATCRSSLEIRPTPSAEKRAVLNASWGSPHILTFSNRCHYIYSRRASDRNTRSALTLVIWNRHAVYSVSRDRRGIEQSPMHRTLPQSARWPTCGARVSLLDSRASVTGWSACQAVQEMAKASTGRLEGFCR